MTSPKPLTNDEVERVRNRGVCRAGTAGGAEHVRLTEYERDGILATLAERDRKIEQLEYQRHDADDCELCESCGRRYLTDYGVPDELWAYLSGHDDGSGLLCLRCLNGRARELGLYLRWEPK